MIFLFNKMSKYNFSFTAYILFTVSTIFLRTINPVTRRLIRFQKYVWLMYDKLVHRCHMLQGGGINRPRCEGWGQYNREQHIPREPRLIMTPPLRGWGQSNPVMF